MGEQLGFNGLPLWVCLRSAAPFLGLRGDWWLRRLDSFNAEAMARVAGTIDSTDCVSVAGRQQPLTVLLSDLLPQEADRSGTHAQQVGDDIRVKECQLCEQPDGVLKQQGLKTQVLTSDKAEVVFYSRLSWTLP